MAPEICQRCHKNTATVHSTEIVDGVMHSVHLCDECAQSEGIGPPLTPQSLLSNLMGPTADDAGQGGIGQSACQFRSGVSASGVYHQPIDQIGGRPVAPAPGQSAGQVEAGYRIVEGDLEHVIVSVVRC